MATKYSRITISDVISSRSDYSQPMASDSFSEELTPSQTFIRGVVEVGTSTVTVGLGNYDSIDYIILVHESLPTAATVTVDFDYATTQGAVTNNLLTNGQIAKIPNPDPGTDLTMVADTGSADIFVIVVGS